MLYRPFLVSALLAVWLIPAAVSAQTAGSTINLSPLSGSRDDEFTIRGSGFTPGTAFAQTYVSPIGDVYDDITINDVPLTVKTDGSGSFHVTIVPSMDFPGEALGAWTVRFCATGTADCSSMSLDVTAGSGLAPELDMTPVAPPTRSDTDPGILSYGAPDNWACPTPAGALTQCPFDDLGGTWKQVSSGGVYPDVLTLTQTGTNIEAGPGWCKNGKLFFGEGPNGRKTVGNWTIGGSTPATFGTTDGSTIYGHGAICVSNEVVMRPISGTLVRTKDGITLKMLSDGKNNWVPFSYTKAN